MWACRSCATGVAGFCCRFRNRTPGPPSFSSMNSTASKATRILAPVSAGRVRPDKNLIDVLHPNPDGGSITEKFAETTATAGETGFAPQGYRKAAGGLPVPGLRPRAAIHRDELGTGSDCAWQHSQPWLNSPTILLKSTRRAPPESACYRIRASVGLISPVETSEWDRRRPRPS